MLNCTFGQLYSFLHKTTNYLYRWSIIIVLGIMPMLYSVCMLWLSYHPCPQWPCASKHPACGQFPPDIVLPAVALYFFPRPRASPAQAAPHTSCPATGTPTTHGRSRPRATRSVPTCSSALGIACHQWKCGKQKVMGLRPTMFVAFVPPLIRFAKLGKSMARQVISMTRRSRGKHTITWASSVTRRRTLEIIYGDSRVTTFINA